MQGVRLEQRIRSRKDAEQDSSHGATRKVGKEIIGAREGTAGRELARHTADPYAPLSPPAVIPGPGEGISPDTSRDGLKSTRKKVSLELVHEPFIFPA